jgi:hypothetical protein
MADLEFHTDFEDLERKPVVGSAGMKLLDSLDT